ncbi:hypothetical protein N7510_007808 [Penicillium lagena]|uniref:uncharacterized protein n=1 Tax=Penicillium lagena TaxID=94218 RepID=UPI002540C263|nr:uncharacterized protein N7510_007808 [Penicillium lagena]KAJ5611089.1 hypothetical protein N7510_007808 [Penicillium lagena]
MAASYLPETVLNERRTVTYRSLGRALKVHATLAKQYAHLQLMDSFLTDWVFSSHRMLFDFHRIENAKKPQTVHATYVVSGIQKPPQSPGINGHGANDEDAIMQSSPYMPSSMPNQDPADAVRVTSIILTREEDLEAAKSTFESISTIHIYSVQPTVLQDLNVLTDVSRETWSAHVHEDPLEFGKKWGMIQNTHVQRRTGARPPPAPTPAVKAAKTSESTVPAKRPFQKEAPPKKADERSSKQSTPASDSQSSAKPATKAAPKREKSDLFSSFAKAKPKPKKAEDVVLDDASEEEPEELFPDQGDKKTDPATRESRKDREEKLKQMMENDDGDDEEMPDADEEEPAREPTPLVEQPPKPAELKEEATVQGGRRRGKRQVIKKRTVKDEEGYLVTREEASWESFSEDEPAPKKKPAVSVGKGKAGKGQGQGNIMSFFGKK